MHISDEGKAYQDAVAKACRGRDGVMGRMAVWIKACPSDKRKRDLDNLLKATLDALNAAGMFEDDSFIDDLHIVRSAQWDNAHLQVEIKSIE